MARKFIALGVLVAALVGGAAAVAACVVAADHTAPVPAAERATGEPKNRVTDDGTAADLTNWQEVRVVVTGSKFR
jgi:opacity protein-like surface antigen